MRTSRREAPGAKPVERGEDTLGVCDRSKTASRERPVTRDSARAAPLAVAFRRGGDGDENRRILGLRLCFSGLASDRALCRTFFSTSSLSLSAMPAGVSSAVTKIRARGGEACKRGGVECPRGGRRAGGRRGR